MIRTHSETESYMTELYKKGKTMRQIAEVFNVSPATVCVHLKKYIPITERQKRQNKFQKTTQETIEEIRKMHKKGASSLIIGKNLGLSSSTILYHLKKMKLDTSKDGKYKSKIDGKKLEEMKKIYTATNSILETAQKMNLHPSSVHYRLKTLGIVKNKIINQKIARKKYELLTEVLEKLYEKMGYKIRYIQKRYNGHGPDMIVENENESVLIEHKATIKRSWYWQHAIEEAKTNKQKYHTARALVITTAKKPRDFKKTKIEILFFDDLKNLLEKNKLNNMISKIEYISTTPSV